MTQRKQVAVITGASSGIGKAAAMALAAQGWRIIGVGRNPERCLAAAAEIRAAFPDSELDMVRGDLSLLADAVRLAGEIAALTDRVDILINNAGGIAAKKIITSEGLEQNFAGNHLGPFLLTDRLLPLLRRAAADAPKGSVRILNTSSDASEMVPGMDFDDLQGLASDNVGLAYCRGKLANVLFARGLAQRLAGEGIVAHAMHPGKVDSNFASYADEAAQARMRGMAGLSVEEGADTLVWLATAQEAGASSGGYFYQRAPRTPNPCVDDDAVVARLWAESEALIAKAGF
jgi:NAD(P)-dependent dehydrogenase (short-subunit alcohol dehydrogenase family)